MTVAPPSGSTVIVPRECPKCLQRQATIYSLIGLAAVIIGARIYLRLKIQRHRLLASDYFMIAAWCSAVLCASVDVVMKVNGALEPQRTYDFTTLDKDPKVIEYLFKVSWLGDFPFFTTFYLCKASLLTTYFQIFPIFMVKRRALLWATTVYCLLAYITTLGLQLFSCLPLERNWVITRPIEECDPKWLPMIFQIAWGLHFFGSLQLFLLPFSIFHDLKMNRRTKNGVYGVFLIGLIDLIFSLTRFLNVQLGDRNGFRSITMIELWSALDAYIGLIVACLPSLRPLLRRNGGSTNKYSGESSGRIPRPQQTDDSEFHEIHGIESMHSRGHLHDRSIATQTRLESR
ncbi:hypothetical protein NCS56_01435800 [Fusarium sp. Ph1]|nr:hypothetical protein NCS56_01435800 [Fusarium sp. Ph1]